MEPRDGRCEFITLSKKFYTHTLTGGRRQGKGKRLVR